MTDSSEVDRLVASFKPDLQLLGLGEPTHLADVFLQFRNRVFQRLVEAHNFCAIAVESSYPRGKIVNDYVHGAAMDIEDLTTRGFSHGFGKLPANRELIEWMRTSGKDLSFYGCDAPTEMAGGDSPRQLLHLAISDGKTLARCDDLIGDDAAWENPAAMYDPNKSNGLSSNAIELRELVEEMIPDLAGEARHDAMQARSLLDYHAAMATPADDRMSKLLSIRDRMMADNLEFIVQRESPRGRVLAFAHNAHLQHGPATWKWGSMLWQWEPAGMHVRRSLGNRYAVIGMGIGELESHGLGEPEPESVEARILGSVGREKFVATHDIRNDESLVARSNTNPGYFPFNKQSLADFDWLVVL